MHLHFPQQMLRYLALTTFVFALSISTMVAQTRTITGKITASSDGTGIPGVNIQVKGTQKGTSSNASGAYSLEVSGASLALSFTSIGFDAQEIKVGNRNVVDVEMTSSTQELNEVVVTALGIKREEKSLGYSVGKVAGKDLNRVITENVLNGLSGKLAGVSINATGATGSSVSMIIRGAKSLSNDNQPLFVIDGVPVINTLNNIGQVGNDNRVDYGNAISDLNPDNIESVSVLKGPSAAALYGSRAGNGVVLITTKTGAKSKKMTINVNSNTVFDNPFKYLDMHSKFATGILPFTPGNNPYPGGILSIEEGSAGGIGPELDKGYLAYQWNSPKDAAGKSIPTELKSYPNNFKNFIQTGITTTNGFSISNSTDAATYRISYSNMTNRGLIPGSDLFKNSIDLATSLNLTDKIKLSTNFDFSRNNSNNRPASERGSNPLQWAYAVSPHINIMDLKDYWVPGREGLQQKSQAIGNYNNPWFLAHEVKNAFERNRFFGNAKLDYQITKELNFMARYSLDTYGETRETKIAPSYTGEKNGAYGLTTLSPSETNIDFLATYAKSLQDFSLSLSVGGNARNSTNRFISESSRGGTGLVIPGLYTLQNIATANIQYSSSQSKKVVYSAYGMANVGYKDMIYLDLTARNDWSSTLPVDNRSYFYPSASLSVLLNEMFQIPNNRIDLIKVRAGVAQAGNDTNPYALFNTLGLAEPWAGVTRLSKPGSILLPDLKPEITTSMDLGLDVTMYKNRLRFSGTYYTVENRNQIIPTTLPASTGFSSKNINAGLLVSKGIELTLGGTPIDKNGWRLDLTTNFYKNATRIEELSEGLNFYTLWTDAKGGAWTYVGDTIGDIYDNELVVVKDQSSKYFGYPILDGDGSWQRIAASNTRNKIGNFNPDFILGLQTSLTYKNWSLNMTFDWRNGGDFVSQTYRYGESDLKSQRFLDNLINPGTMTGDALRNYLVANQETMIKVNGNQFNIVGGPTKEYGGYPFEYGGKVYPNGVFNPGVIAQYDGKGNITGYEENLGGPNTRIIPYGDNYPWDFTRAAMFDASFVKLREVSLAYELPSNVVKKLGLQAANFSVYSRNIILWTAAKIGIDPETAFQPQAGAQAGTQFKQGIERYNVTPWVIPVGFRLGLTF
jgi:TonB-linked SusC/RagA family outer membrane protein